jgi:hypothetical protein
MCICIILSFLECTFLSLYFGVEFLWPALQECSKWKGKNGWIFPAPCHVTMQFYYCTYSNKNNLEVMLWILFNIYKYNQSRRKCATRVREIKQKPT